MGNKLDWNRQFSVREQPGIKWIILYFISQPVALECLSKPYRDWMLLLFVFVACIPGQLVVFLHYPNKHEPWLECIATVIPKLSLA